MKVRATIQSGIEMRETNTFSIQVVTNPFRECQIASKVTFTTNGGEWRVALGKEQNQRKEGEMGICVEVRK